MADRHHKGRALLAQTRGLSREGCTGRGKIKAWSTTRHDQANQANLNPANFDQPRGFKSSRAIVVFQIEGQQPLTERFLVAAQSLVTRVVVLVIPDRDSVISDA